MILFQLLFEVADDKRAVFKASSLAQAADVFIPKLAQRNFSIGRSGFEIKGGVGGDANGYVALA